METVKNIVISSAIKAANHIPSTSNNSGSNKTAATWHKKVRKKEMSSDNVPLDNAVKNEDAKIFSPVSKKHREYIRKPLVVKAKSSRSSRTKMRDNGVANKQASAVITIPAIKENTTLLVKMFFSSFIFNIQHQISHIIFTNWFYTCFRI